MTKFKHSPGLKRSLLICILFTVVFLRCLPRWQNLPVWAEDGAVFLSEAYKYSWASFFMTYAGYFHLFPRFMALVLSWLGAQYFAHFVFISTLMLFAVVASELSRERYSNFIASRFLRTLLSLSFCFTPGLSENLGNLGNAHWFLAVYVCMLLFRNRLDKLGVFDWVMIVFASFSAGEVILFIPVALLRAYFEKENRKSSLGIAALISLGAIPILTSGHTKPVVLPAVSKLVEAYFYSMINQVWVHPFFGDTMSYRIGNEIDTLYWSLAVLFPISLWLVARQKSLESRLFFAVFLCASLFPILYGAVREEGLQFWSSMKRDPNLTLQRQGYLVGVAGLFYITKFLSDLTKKRGRVFPIAFMCLYIAMASTRFSVHLHDPSPRWDTQIVWHREHSTESHVNLAIVPPGWYAPVPIAAYGRKTALEKFLNGVQEWFL